MYSSDGHNEFVLAALRRLGRAPTGAPPAVRLLAGGLSGSAVYRLDLDGEDLVLKVTLPGTAPQLLARSRREARFYQELVRNVPLSVPRLIDANREESESVVLLLAAAEPSPPPDAWTKDDFSEIAQQLGRFHATFWGKTTEFDMPGWIPDKPPVTVADCQHAARHWDALFERDDLRDMLAPHWSRVRLLLTRIPILEPGFASLPATLCHGDCHTGNLLRGPAGEWIWADWQDVRLGPGVDDLSFLWQRAFAATDIAPSNKALVEAYAAGLETDSGSRTPREKLERDLIWAELRSWVVDWPPYLGFLPIARIERMLERIGLLAKQMRIAERP